MLVATLTWLLGANAQAGQHRYSDIVPLFWNELYDEGGETLYCGIPFAPGGGRGLSIEHVMPMAWAMNLLGCDDRNRCRTQPQFNRIESDLHNLFPSDREINRERGSHSFGEIDGENHLRDGCDFEVDPRRRLVEPRPAARGDIARAMFHMHESYGIDIRPRLGITLKRWNREDPPDAGERRRNDLIERLQGTRNRFIDDPAAADGLWF